MRCKTLIAALVIAFSCSGQTPGTVVPHSEKALCLAMRAVPCSNPQSQPPGHSEGISLKYLAKGDLHRGALYAESLTREHYNGITIYTIATNHIKRGQNLAVGIHGPKDQRAIPQRRRTSNSRFEFGYVEVTDIYGIKWSPAKPRFGPIIGAIAGLATGLVVCKIRGQNRNPIASSFQEPYGHNSMGHRSNFNNEVIGTGLILGSMGLGALIGHGVDHGVRGATIPATNDADQSVWHETRLFPECRADKVRKQEARRNKANRTNSHQ